ncbi:hypothetical protein [Spongiibacter sp. UBA6593]|uniref:hypothetical protein n=1 Tax=Spongiibacter sp. UBA6593 TaxID=1947544 RepID=UPI00257DB348|nr:hypothetical protein [Spongiibacter sp. UBA6593]
MSDLTGIDEFLRSESLPASYCQQVDQYFLPFIQRWLAVELSAPKVLGIHGAQGSGKSTLAAFYQWYLRRHCGKRVACLSLDDFYLPRGERLRLGSHQHPLLATRGVPGTHDLPLSLGTLEDLRAGRPTALPRFDKARDDRCEVVDWPRVGAVDVIILEGWCLGVPPQAESELADPINALEAEEDSDGRWRRWVNDQLAGSYQQLFAELDCLLMLKAPSFDCVASWREEQEQKMAARRADDDSAHFMSSAEILRFVSHYERLTRHALSVLPARADAVMTMDERRSIVSLSYKGSPG